MNKIHTFIAILACAGILFASCEKDEPIVPDNPIVPEETPRGLVTITPGDITEMTITCSFIKNDSCIKYDILATEPGQVELYVGSFFGNTREAIISSWAIHALGDTTYTWEEMNPNTTYVIYALAYKADNTTVIYTDTVKTAALGGHGTSVITLNVTNIGATTATTIATPNAETAFFKDILFEANILDTLPIDTLIVWMQSDPNLYYQTDTWDWTDLDPETEYIFMAQGQNVDGTWGDLTQFPFTTECNKSATKRKAAKPMTLHQGRIVRK